MADEVLGPSRYRIQDLQPGMCRWVTDETPHNQCYCGGKTIKSTSWCEEHYSKCLLDYLEKRANLIRNDKDCFSYTITWGNADGGCIISIVELSNA